MLGVCLFCVVCVLVVVAGFCSLCYLVALLFGGGVFVFCCFPCGWFYFKLFVMLRFWLLCWLCLLVVWFPTVTLDLSCCFNSVDIAYYFVVLYLAMFVFVFSGVVCVLAVVFILRLCDLF